MAIELPDLVQRVRVDTSDVARAEKRLKASSKSFDETAESVERLGDAQDDVADSSANLRTETDRTVRSQGRAAAAGERLADSVGAVRQATESVRAATSGAAQSAEELRATELRLETAQRRVQVAQSRLNRLRTEGKSSADQLARAELNAIDAMRAVAREQARASKIAKSTRTDTDGLSGALTRFINQSRKAGGAGGLIAHGFSLIKIPAIVTGLNLAVGALGALGAGAVAAVGAFGPLVGAVAALPAALIALKSSTAVFKQLTEGPAEASKAIRQYGADSEQAKEALAALSPEAREFALALEDTQGRLETIKRAGQDAALPGFTDALKEARSLLPVVQRGFVGVAVSLSQVARRGATAFSTPVFRRDLGIIADRNATLVNVLGRAAIRLVGALKGVVLAAGPMVDVFSRSALALARTANQFTNSADGQRRMAGFFARSTTVVFSFVRSLRDLSVGLINVFRIGSRAIGIDFVGGLERASAEFREFTESVTGQTSIASYFADARPALVETGRLLRDLVKALGGLSRNADLAPVIAQVRTELLPALVSLSRSVGSRLGPTIIDLATAFIKFQEVLSFSPILAVAGALARLTIAIADVVGAVPGLSTVVATLVAFKFALAGIATIGKFTGISSLAGAITAAGTAGTAGKGGLTGFVQGLKGLDAASLTTVTRTNRLGAALRGINVSASGSVANVGKLRGAVGGLAGVFGGPWGLAVGAGVTLLFAFARRNAEAKARVDELRSSLDQQTGAITENTRVQAANRLLKKGVLDDADRLGFSLRDVTDAAVGNAEATARVEAHILSLQTALKAQVAAGKATAADYFAQRIAINDLTDAIGIGSEETRKAQEQQRLLAAAGAATSTAVDGTATSMYGLADATASTVAASAAARSAFIRSEVQAGKTRKEAKKLADALGLVKAQSPVNVSIAVDGIDPAIARIAELRNAILGIPTSVTVGVLNKVKGSGGALGVAPSTPPSPTSARVAERAPAVAATKAAEKDTAAVAKTAGATAGKEARKAFTNEFVKSGTDLTKAGDRLVSNLVKALTGSQERIRKAGDDLRSLVRGAFSGSQEDALIKRVRDTNNKLLALARQRDALTERIKSARDDVISAAASAGSGLQDSITDSGNPIAATGTDDEGVVSTNILRIIGNLRSKVEAAKRFATDLRELKKRGINADTLRQLVEAGPEAGGMAARELARATDKQLAEVNRLQGTLASTGAKAGEFAQTTLEKMGLDAIGGLLKGIRARRSEVETEMLKIAKIMRDSIRKALGIHSPSTVMAADAADPAVDGLVGQLRKRRSDVAREAARLGDAVIPSVPLSSSAGGLPQTTVNNAAGQRIGTVINIDRIVMETHNPRAEPLAETTAPDNLRKVAAVLSR